MVLKKTVKYIFSHILFCTKVVEGIARYPLMKCTFFTEMDDYLPYAFFMVLWSLQSKKLCFLLIPQQLKKLKLDLSLNQVEGSMKDLY